MHRHPRHVQDMRIIRYRQQKRRTFGHAFVGLFKTRWCRLLTLVLKAGLALMVCSVSLVHAAGPNMPARDSAEMVSAVTIQYDSQWNATIYSISRADCTIQWIARNAEIGVIKHWSRCKASLSEQGPLWEKICAEFFSKDKNAHAFRTLFWGRLEPEISNGSRELSLRLALAAYRSPGWNGKRGTPKSGDLEPVAQMSCNSI